MGDLTLVVRRHVRASPQALFDAWTRPELLIRWWGPQGVTCPEAEVDLRPGGRYAIANETPSGTLWIRGEFLVIEAPNRLVYTWRVGDDGPNDQRVTVRFEPREDGTEVIVLHEHIADQATADDHEAGWQGCLEGLAVWAAGREG